MKEPNGSNEKSKRYDRQIRIWGAHGQQRLETCKVALLNCSPTGSETLKNLVLGGIASFTIVDGVKVQANDLGNNFLVSANSLGEPRAKVVTELLQELNETVAGSYVEEEPEELINTNPNFFADFSLVIATQLRETEVIKLDEICRQHKTPLLIARSYGLVGYLRTSLPEHCVIESKPDNVVDDLRLHRPFPELHSFALSFNLDTVDDVTHHHLPYAVLLIQAAEQWRSQHGDKSPSNSKERSAFKEIINGLRRCVDGVPVEEDNFDEALKAAFHVWTPYSISSEVRSILEDEAASSLTADSDDFWVLAAALRAFVEQEGEGHLPLEGVIPDMHSTTDLYLRLQRVYKERADRDVRAVEGHVRAILGRIGREPSSIPLEAVRYYCRNARNLRVVRYRTLSEEYGGDSGRGSLLQQALSGESSAPDASFYVLLRAADRFYATHGRFPGSLDHETEADVPALKALAGQIISEMGASGNVSDDCVVEMCRFGAGELHVVAAMMGGMAAQEAIKLITRQFTPVAGSLLFNAVGVTSTVLEL
mmetsp:Transcript_8982/g.19249  ORF Transcript_8982/g.19249 Transcript_8982/m.19249 type:complete len:537 (+) Transcript_8982:66-1676(+)|eukprot:CAMPEP_0202891004 /NCGR_PEP_ID=MMETSP1392-20130828/1212_1 /ASSEMBLY_ACC=CAM_ASM_000868 /TAXON_ID=225041 /ORGANISM="Chlamydomonas chlamydogama, Strain SAG 11-48b" /LENGTH=536 /DNA_ID=CAMNT_0049574665 /DNA_START=59 /DNA_END=1669 /DNA_ORIENTATION=+